MPYNFSPNLLDSKYLVISPSKGVRPSVHQMFKLSHNGQGAASLAEAHAGPWETRESLKEHDGGSVISVLGSPPA